MYLTEHAIFEEGIDFCLKMNLHFMLKEQKAKMFVIILYVACIDVSVFLRTWAVKHLISVFLFMFLN